MFVQLFCRNNVVNLSYQCYVKLMDDLATSLLRQLVVREMRAAFWLPLNLINPLNTCLNCFFALVIGGCRLCSMRSDCFITLWSFWIHARKGKKNELDFTMDGLRNQRARS